MTLSENDDIELRIDGFTSEGSGVGHYDGMAVFVPGGAKGDTVLCHIIKAKKNYAIGKLLEIRVPSPDRIAPDCRVFPRCGGCAYRHIAYEAETALKTQRVVDCFARLGHIEIFPEPIVGGVRERYRNKAQYPVRTERGEVKIGFYSEKSHRVTDCKDCLLQPAEFAGILRIFRAFLAEHRISVYDETAGTGLVRHICLRKAFVTGEIMAVIVVNGKSLPASGALVSRLTEAFPQIESVFLNVNTADTNVVLGEKYVLLSGREYIEDVLCGVRVRLGPASFYQVNHDNAEKLYALAAEYLAPTGEETVIDLYCGAGTIGLSMADKIKSLIGVEIVPEAIENARKNAEINGIENAEFLCADAEEAAAELLSRGVRPDAVIVDPPRKGCGATLPATIDKMDPKKIIYISCDPATLARDCAVFASLGWRVDRARPVDMFPATSHVETVVSLVRKTPDMYVDFKIDLDDQDLTASEAHPTYEEIKTYIQREYGVKVSSLYISQVKRKLGLEVGESFNKPKSENAKQPQCPPDKEKIITAALVHYKII